jgi:O-antigen ligase
MLGKVLSGREMVIIGGTLALAGGCVMIGVEASAEVPMAAFLCLAIAALALAGWIVLAAMAGSRPAIITYFAVLAFMTDAQFRVRGAGEITSDWQSVLKFALWLGAGMIGCTHMPPLRTLLSRPGPALWLLYIFIALLSSLYSPIGGYSFGCAFALLCLFAFSFALTARLTESQILWTLGITLAVFCLGGWVVFYIYPELGTSPFWTYGGMYLRMCGLAGQANNLGAVCSKGIGCAFLLWYGRRCGPLAALLLGSIAFVTLVKSDARTGELAVMAGVGAVILSRSRGLLGAGILAAVVGFVAMQVFPHLLDGLGAQFSRSGDPSEIYTLTGRLEIWDFAWRKITESPLLGYGYNSTKIVLGKYYDLSNGLMVDSAHNMFLQNLLSVGAIGSAPLIALLGYLTYRFVVRPLPIVSYFTIVILTSAVSDTDAIGTTPTLMTVVFLVISVWPGLYETAPARVTRPMRTSALLAAPA